jgi:hypothetical protein
MSALRRALPLLGLLVLVGGCNPFLFPFLVFGPEPKHPPEYHHLAGKNKKEVKVVILTYMGMDMNTDLLHADREIARWFAKELVDLCEYNEEKVMVVNPAKVEEYKNKNPDWHLQHSDLSEIGKHFKADYVIYLEINRLSLFQPGTSNLFYRGQANMTLSLVDVKNPDDFSTPPRELTFTYPSEARGGNRVVDMDTPLTKFRADFFTALARKLAWHFTAHPTNQHNLD